MAIIPVVALVLLAGVAATWATIDEGAVRVVVALAGAAVAAALLLGMVGIIGGRGSPQEASSRERTDEQPTRTSNAVPLRPADIRLTAPPEDQLPAPPRVVGELTDGSFLVVGVSGLDPGSPGSVHQCRPGALAASECRPGLPMSADDNGRATVLVDLVDGYVVPVAGADPVDCTDAVGCSILVFGSSRLEVVTVFGRPASPPATVSAEPARLAPGDTTFATARGLPPGELASFVVCRPAGRGEVDCGAPTRAGTVGRTGEATAPVNISAGRCPRGATCAIAVVMGDGGPRAFRTLHLIGRSGATYQNERLRLGVVAAVVLMLVALALLRRTDWTPVDGDPFAGVVIPRDPFADVPDP